MKKYLLSLLFLLLCGTTALYAQLDTQFWFSMPYLATHSSGAKYHLYLFADKSDAHVTISMPANPSFTPIHVTVPNHGSQDVLLASSYAIAQQELAVPWDQISRKGLYISTDAPIYSYVQITDLNGEAYTLKGHRALGTEFYVLSQNNMVNGSGIGDYEIAYHSIQIVATQNNTRVTIYPTVQMGTNCSTEPIQILLQRGETYACRCCSKEGAGHMAGTRIVSDKPIAVNSSDDSVNAPGTGGYDLAGEQITPTDYWGTEYIAVSQDLSWDYVYVTAKEDSTRVTTSKGIIFTLNQGETRAVPIRDVKALYVQSDKPVGVWQITGLGVEIGGTNLPIIDCTGSESVKYKQMSDTYQTRVNIVTASPNVEHFTLNGNPIDPTNFSVVPGTNGKYSFARINVTGIVPIDSLIDVECSSGLFQMGVINSVGSSSSCTLGYFSDYSTKHEYVEYVIYDEGPIYIWPNHYEADGVTPRTLSHAGDYRDTLTAQNGCDSICLLHLMITPFPQGDTTAVLCEGEPFTWWDQTYTTAGDYIHNYPYPFPGIDSVVTLHLRYVQNPEITVRPDTMIMRGDSALLWATGADYYEWSPTSTLARMDDGLVYAKPTENTTYTVTGYMLASGAGGNVVFNGDFEQGNTGFTSDMLYRPGFKPTGTSGEYSINDAVNKFWESSSAPDAATAPAYGGSGLMMIVDGANWANAVLWQQQVEVTPHTYYTFSAQVMSCLASNKHGKYALLQFSVNGTQLGEVFHSPTTLYEWSRYYEVWYSGNNTTATLTIYNQNTDHNGNDFAIDDIRFEPMHKGCTATQTVEISVKYICDTIIASASVPTICADAPSIPVEVQLSSGEVGEYTVHFTNAAMNTMPFRDTTITIPTQYASATPFILDVPVPSDPTDRSRYPRPDDTYTMDLTIRDRCGNEQEWFRLPFTVLYPSWITEQHWDDVISLVNDTYNGGYTFSHVAWLRDGVELEGENNYYIYLPHDLWTDETHTTHATYQYQALLTRTDDGKTFLTCPMEPTPIDKTDMMDGNNPYVDVTPRLVPKENPVVELSTNTVGTYWLYDMAGSLVQTGTYAPCVHAKLDLRVPDIRSMYVLVFTPTGVKKPLDEKYRVIRIIVE